METLGVWLRQSREAKGSTLEEVEAATRIRPRLLQALEADDFDSLSGGEVQIRGFLRLYARYLDLSPDQVLARYDAEVHGVQTALPDSPGEAQLASSTASTVKPLPPQPRDVLVPTPPPRAVNLATVAIMGTAIIALLAVIVAGGYYAIRNAGGGTTTSATATMTISTGAGISPTAMATPALPTITPTFPVNPQGGVTLALEPTEHVWARITVDGLLAFSGMLAPGQGETQSGQEAITVETGNGAGLLVVVNGQPMGTMCGRAQVCTRTWGPSGEITGP
jgi:cytoskeleton protein RodZ